MPNTDYGSILLTTADKVSRTIMKKTGSQTGYKPSEWADEVNLMGLLPIRTASGSIAHFEDGADDVPMKSVVANIVPIQDLHGYSKPWAAGAGKNKCLFISDGKVPSISNGELVNYYGCRTDYIKAKASTQYTFSGTVTIATCYFFYYDANHDFISYQQGQLPMTRTTPNDCAYVMLRNDSSLSDIVNAQFEEGSTATSYEPYANVCPISGTDELTLTRTGKNLFDEANATLSNLSLSNHVFTNTNTDTRANLQFQAVLLDDNLQTIQSLFSQSVTATGAFSRTITITNSGYSKLMIKHNGSTRDLRIIVPFTYPKETVTISANFLGVDVSTVGGLSFENLQIEIGSTATDFEPYNAETYTFDLGQEIMGGSADCVGGIGESERVLDTIVDSGWSKYSNFFYRSYSDKKRTSTADEYPLFCSMLQNGGTITSSTSFHDGFIYQNALNDNIYIVDSSVASIDDFYVKYGGCQICYELATPTDFTFEGEEINSYLGVNNLYVDSGEVLDVEYRADMNLLIASLEGNRGLQMMRVTPTEENDEQEVEENETER